MNGTAILALLLALMFSNVLAWTVVIVTRAFNRDDLNAARDWSARMTNRANDADREAQSARLDANRLRDDFAMEYAKLRMDLADAERRARRRQRTEPRTGQRAGETDV